MEQNSLAHGKSAFALSNRLLRQHVSRPSQSPATGLQNDPDDLQENYEWFTVDAGVVQHHFAKNDGCVGVGDDIADATDPSVCPTKAEDGQPKLKAQFGRRWTHNEQILVRPCGIILVRATFFGAEAVSNVLVSFRLVTTFFADQYLGIRQEGFHGSWCTEAQAFHL
jgi:hypothetical protein